MKKKEKVNNKKKAVMAAYLLAATLLLGIAGYTFAYFSAQVTYTNKTNTVLKAQSLSLTFRGTNEVVNCSNIVPGDKCIKTFEVENTSSVETFYNIYMENPTNGFNEDLVYTLKEGNTEVVTETVVPATKTGKEYIKTNVTIAGGATKQYTLTIEFKYTEGNQNVNQGKQFTTTVGIDTAQQTAPVAYKCKRATTLHTEECAPSNTDHYCAGAGYTASGSKGTTTITYGNLGTKGQAPQSGDAFDCDINNDGIYNSENERFYYVSTKTNGITQDPNTAVLIYYNDYVTSPVEYALKSDTGLSTDSNEKGPVTAIKNLPTINDWSTTLTNTTRDITDLNNTVKVSNFQYKVNGVDLAARLLTAQEINAACAVGSHTEGELDGCNYLMENTLYSKSTNPTIGTWLETNYSSYSRYALIVNGTARDMIDNYVNDEYSTGARPAIEVAKTDIDY